MRALRGTLVDRLEDERMGVANRHDAEAIVKVDVFISVDVPYPAALAAIDENRLRRRILEGRRHPARNELLGLLPEVVGPVPLRPEPFLLLRDQFDDPLR